MTQARPGGGGFRAMGSRLLLHEGSLTLGPCSVEEFRSAENEWFSRPELMRFSGFPWHRTAAERSAWYQSFDGRSRFLFAVRQEGSVVGLARLSSEPHHGRAYADLALADAELWTSDTARFAGEGLAELAFGHIDSNKLLFHAYGDNALLRTALEAWGFALEGVYRAHDVLPEEDVQDVCVFAKLRRDWRTS